MNENKFRLLKADIQVEIENLSRLKEEIEELIASIKREPSNIELRAMGSILHDFYCGVERIFERIAIDIDGEIPKGAEWHTQLLIRMGAEIESIRPAVISRKFQNQLKEYLRFRHLFRNIYGFELEWRKNQDLVNSVPELYTKFRTEITTFFEFIDTLTKETTSGT